MTFRKKLYNPRTKVGLLELGKQLCNVSKACRIMSYSRDSFYRFEELYETGRRAALQEISRSEPNLRNRIAEEIENGVVELAIEEPAWGQVRVANELKRKGLMISNAGVHCVERPTSRKQDSGSAVFLGD